MPLTRALKTLTIANYATLHNTKTKILQPTLRSKPTMAVTLTLQGDDVTKLGSIGITTNPDSDYKQLSRVHVTIRNNMIEASGSDGKMAGYHRIPLAAGNCSLNPTDPAACFTIDGRELANATRPFKKDGNVTLTWDGYADTLTLVSAQLGRVVATGGDHLNFAKQFTQPLKPVSDVTIDMRQLKKIVTTMRVTDTSEHEIRIVTIQNSDGTQPVYIETGQGMRFLLKQRKH